MNRLKILIAVAFTIGCTAETASRADSAAAPIESATASVPSENPSTNPVETPSTNPADWKVNTRGIGPLTAGMTLDEANAAVGNTLVIPATMQECDWVRIENGPDGLLFMVEQGKISRVDVDKESTITTEAGAKIGDTEDRIRSLYPAVEIQPHKYTDGHYLVVTPSATADQAYRIVFETDGQKVLRYRSGRMPAVQYVEGCS